MSVTVTGYKSSVIFENMKNINPEVASDISAVYEFVLSLNGKQQSWTVDLKSSPPSIKLGKPSSGKADCTLITSDENFLNIMNGSLDATELFMSGGLKIKGDMSLAMKLGNLKGSSSSSGSAKTESKTESKVAVAGFNSSTFFVELDKTIKESPEIMEVSAVYEFALTNSKGDKQSWTVDLKNGKGGVFAGKVENVKPDCTMITSDDSWMNIMSGSQDATELFMSGGLKIKGDMSLAMKLDTLKSKNPKSKL